MFDMLAGELEEGGIGFCRSVIIVAQRAGGGEGCGCGRKRERDLGFKKTRSSGER